MNPSRPFFSTAFLTILGRSVGFIIPFLIAAFYGATPTTDAFFFALGILLVFVSLFTHIFESALIPFLAEQGDNSAACSSMVNRTFLGTLFAAVLLAIVGSIGLTPALIHFGHLNRDTAALVGRYFFQMTPFLIFSVASAACHSMMFREKIFWMPAISPLFRSIGVILCMILFRKELEMHAVTLGFAVGEILRWGMTFLILKLKTSWQPVFNRPAVPAKSKAVLTEMIYQGMALLVGNSLFLVDQGFAAQLGEGSLSFLNYADRLLQIPYILLISAFLQIFLTDWSDTYYADPLYHFWPKVHRDVGRVFLICSVLSGLLWIGRDWGVQLVYGRSNLASSDLKMIADLFGWLSLGFIPGVVRLLCGRVLFVMKKSRLYCIQTCAELVANVLFNILFIRLFGLVGIAMATALVYAVSTTLVYIYIRQKVSRNFSV